ncbi:kinase [Sporosarcina thermotolerans]
MFLNRSFKERPFIVGVDGMGGAGKTTFSTKIVQELKRKNCKLLTLHLDNHIVEKNKRYQTGQDEWYEYYYMQWDLSGIRTNLLEPLHSHDYTLLQFYDKFNDSFSASHIKIIPDSIVIIEGIFLQREEWRSFFDFVIFIDCPHEIRKERVLNRDSYIGNYQERLKKYTERYWQGEKYYMDKVKPVSIADLVIAIS